MTLDPDYVTKAERERRQQTAQKETKVAKTISIPISYWALLDQVKNKLGKKNVNETLMYCIKEIGIEEGIESAWLEKDYTLTGILFLIIYEIVDIVNHSSHVVGMS